MISQMRNAFIFSLAVFLSPTVTLAAAEPVAARPEASAKSDAGNADYVLQPEDLIRVLVFQEEDINKQGDVRISQEYTVSLPLIGTVNLKGKTASQARELIRQLYDRDYLVNPRVNLIVVEYKKRSVNVVGAVTTQGVVYFPQEEGLDLLGAIGRAGGFTRIADKKHVTLKRTKADGTTETFPINAEEIVKGKSSDAWPLQPGDKIFVPEIFL